MIIIENNDELSYVGYSKKSIKTIKINGGNVKSTLSVSTRWCKPEKKKE